ncbi:hypothetical protein N7486_004395 [Penicillium sp. IBT 16267x]|nr:hypothetical protein N7486_004395 [Penicillium sp. IBT 16267x]
MVTSRYTCPFSYVSIASFSLNQTLSFISTLVQPSPGVLRTWLVVCQFFPVSWKVEAIEDLTLTVKTALKSTSNPLAPRRAGNPPPTASPSSSSTQDMDAYITCWKCGQMGHRSPVCRNEPLPFAEQQKIRNADIARRDAKAEIGRRDPHLSQTLAREQQARLAATDPIQAPPTNDGAGSRRVNYLDVDADEVRQWSNEDDECGFSPVVLFSSRHRRRDQRVSTVSPVQRTVYGISQHAHCGRCVHCV